MGKVVAVDGSMVNCGVASIDLIVNGRSARISALVMDRLIPEFDVILGMDMVKLLGGVCVLADSSVHFGVHMGRPAQFGLTASRKGELRIEDRDFTARFDGYRWIVRWNWTDREPNLSNRVPAYKISDDMRNDFEKEINSWIDEEILVPVPDGVQIRSIIPLMAVRQPHKQSVRPVLDFKQINEYVSSHTGNSTVCDDTIRRWRRFGDNVTLLDLRKAYLQLYVDQKQWKHQVVQFKGKFYYLTRLGFGLSSAPRIMSRILQEVLSMKELIRTGTSNYLDDILVNNDVVSPECVEKHLHDYGLKVKPSQSLQQGARILGLQVELSNEKLYWKRANQIPSAPDLNNNFSRRELFSLCGQLVGHYPVANWLRVACGYVKRSSNGKAWEDDIGSNAKEMLRELLDRIAEFDPVRGAWSVSSNRGKVWCDASSLSIACALEIDGNIVEDGAWLRREDSNHINMLELESILKGLNMAAKWGLRELEIMTDSATVAGWLRSALLDTHMVRTHGMNEMLIKRRLAVVKDICKEFDIQAKVTWVESSRNKSDALTRVSKRWLNLRSVDASSGCVAVCEEESTISAIRFIHNQHHFGVNRTFHLAKLKFPSVTREEVSRVIKSCVPCRSIDPAPVRWEKGGLEVEDNWRRIAIDVTHYGGKCYLTMIDCGPSRFSVWRRILDESVDSILSELIQLFRERGPPEQILMDNARSFRSAAMRSFLREWSVEPLYRCAHRPEGNAIIERLHRTIKSKAARSNADPLQIVYWYNVTPRDGTNEETVPSVAVHKYRWRMPMLSDPTSTRPQKDELHGFKRGDTVFVKPASARCTYSWPPGIITDIISDQQLEIDGIPRHVADVRAISPQENSEENNTASEEGAVEVAQSRPIRSVRRPEFYGNNIYDM